ncbi:Solute carrier family 49 member A3, partial [Fragariocoptes setiger]
VCCPCGKYTTLRAVDNWPAISSAASKRRNSTKASPDSPNAFANSDAASLSPSDEMIAACLICSALSTKKRARSASCWATCFISTAFIHSSSNMDRDLDTISNDLSSENHQYKVYKRRFLVLFAFFNLALVVGLHRSLISITDVLNSYLNIGMVDYDRMTQVSMYTTLVSVLVVARMLDHYGLRRMSYVACVIIICANSLKALCCWHDVAPWIKLQRFNILILSEAFVGVAISITFCVPAKVAGVWFANNENTLALVIICCGYNIGFAISNYFTPVFVLGVNDMPKLSYMFLISAFLLTMIVLTCVTRSSPKTPPSACAIVSANSNSIPLRLGLRVMMTDISYLMLHLTLAINIALINVEQLQLEDILKAQDYSDSFCGTLIAHSYFFGIFFMLIAAFWIDNSSNITKVSRISAILCGLSIIAFNVSMLFPDIRSIILATNIMTSFGSSLLYPALMQVAIRCANGILAEATVSSVALAFQQILMSLLVNLISPLSRMSDTSPYLYPMIVFLTITSVVNTIYVVFFTVPNKARLQEKIDGAEQLIADSI